MPLTRRNLLLRQAHRGAALALWAATAMPVAVQAAPPQEELLELRARIQEMQQQLSETEESRQEAVDSLKAYEQAISEANRGLHDLAQQQRKVRAELSQLQSQSGAVEANIQRQQVWLEKLVRERYIHGPTDTLPLLLNGGDPDRIMRQMHYLTYVSRARAEVIQDLRVNLQSLRELGAQAKQKSAELAGIEAQQIQENNRLRAESQARKRVVVSLAAEITKQRQEIATLKRDENRLTRLVEEIARVLARREAARKEAERIQAQRDEARRRRAARAEAGRKSDLAENRSSSGLRNDVVPDESFNGSPFDALKGKLRLPVRGELTNRFGSPRSDGGLTWKGLFIRASAGEDVKAIAAGRVVFADWLRGFGNLLILDHGGGFMSLYGNNEALYGQVGDSVQAGQTVAMVGNSGGNVESGLYFELRFQSKPLDPLTWIARQ